MKTAPYADNVRRERWSPRSISETPKVGHNFPRGTGGMEAFDIWILKEVVIKVGRSISSTNGAEHGQKRTLNGRCGVDYEFTSNFDDCPQFLEYTTYISCPVSRPRKPRSMHKDKPKWSRTNSRSNIALPQSNAYRSRCMINAHRKFVQRPLRKCSPLQVGTMKRGPNSLRSWLRAVIFRRSRKGSRRIGQPLLFQQKRTTVRTHSKPLDDNSRQEAENPTVRNSDQDNRVLQVFDVLNTKADQLRDEEQRGHYRHAPNTPQPPVFSKVCSHTYPIGSESLQDNISPEKRIPIKMRPMQLAMLSVETCSVCHFTFSCSSGLGLFLSTSARAISPTLFIPDKISRSKSPLYTKGSSILTHT